MKSAVIEATETRPVVIVGYGNTLRRDDGAGVMLAERLAIDWWEQGKPVRLVTVHQLVPELAGDIADDAIAAVVFIDTEIGLPTDEVRIRRLDPEAAALTFCHHIDPATLCTYAAVLYGRSVPAWLVTVPGVDFGHGETISPAVRELLATSDNVARRLSCEIEASALCTN